MDYSLPMISLSTKAKRRRRTSQEETCILEDYFSRNPNPNQREKEEIAKKVNMEPKNVHFWFQNRRAKNSKRRKLAEESAQVKHEQANPQTRTLDTVPQQQHGPQQSKEPSKQKQRGVASRERAHPLAHHLPPISSILHQPQSNAESGPSWCQRPLAAIPGTSSLQVPLIPFFFHHSTFGIEPCMLQWSKGRQSK